MYGLSLLFMFYTIKRILFIFYFLLIIGICHRILFSSEFCIFYNMHVKFSIPLFKT